MELRKCLLTRIILCLFMTGFVSARAGGADSVLADDRHGKEVCVKNMYCSVIPAHWDTERWKGPDFHIRYTDYSNIIEVARYGPHSLVFKSYTDFIGNLSAGGAPLQKVGKIIVAGAAAEHWRKHYPLVWSGEELPTRHSEWAYDEYVILRDEGSFWVFHFQSFSPVYEPEPESRHVWLNFLKQMRFEGQRKAR